MVRAPAVAGSFYPSDPSELRDEVELLLEGSVPLEPGGELKAIVSPHAGYAYSGAVAGAAWRHVKHFRDRVEHVVLLGPSHRVPFEGIALSTADAFRTPLGDLDIDHEFRDAVVGLPGVRDFDDAHAQEHSIEVQLPFLQVVLGSPKILPLVVGWSSPRSVSVAIGACLLADPAALVVVSSDLSHYLTHALATEKDRHTAELVEGRESVLNSDQACGSHPINGLLERSRKEGWRLETLDLRTSGDTCGDRDRVVGYGAFAAWGLR